jgi:hypothetical protein
VFTLVGIFFSVAGVSEAHLQQNPTNVAIFTNIIFVIDNQ